MAKRGVQSKHKHNKIGNEIQTESTPVQTEHFKSTSNGYQNNNKIYYGPLKKKRNPNLTREGAESQTWAKNHKTESKMRNSQYLKHREKTLLELKHFK